MNGIIDTNTFMMSAIWLSQLCYLLGFVPQILLNYRLKSVSGLSDFYILAFFIGYIAELFYVFCLQLPIPYQLVVPISTMAMTMLVFQRFYYGIWNNWSAKLLAMYFSIAVTACVLIPVAIANPYICGHVAGWLTTCVWCTYQLPQVIKIFLTRTVVGFSFGLATMIALAAFIECGAGVLLNLPYQTIITSARGVLVYIIFSLQFVLFRR